MLEWFLDHGADLNARSRDWDLTPTSSAMYMASLETIDYLFTRGANARCGQLLHHAVLRDQPNTLDVVRRVVEQGAPINEVSMKRNRIRIVSASRLV
jgi:ankyrin repeat protein